MCFPVMLCSSGLLSYTDLTNPLRHEGLHIVAYMTIFSSLLWIPYLGLHIAKWKALRVSFQAITSIPFFAMLGMTVYADLEGVPW